MCVIVYKPIGRELPKTDVLKACFGHNPDGAGLMLPIAGKVRIRKGLMTFDAFADALVESIAETGKDPKDIPIVMHFRISTQGGVSRSLCHPFPICDSYRKMRKLWAECDMAVAHNGIISLTSESNYSYGHYENGKYIRGALRKLNHNDTMKFVKDYLCLIADGDKRFCSSPSKATLIRHLLGGWNKLAIMDGDGNVDLIGHFETDDGIIYSNLNHKAAKTDDVSPTTADDTAGDGLEWLGELMEEYEESTL